MEFMKFSNLLFFILLLGLVSCGNDEVMEDDDVITAPVYKIAILSPNDFDKQVGDTLAIQVNFDEETMTTVHHINVQIYQKGDTSKVIFNRPTEPHVHETSGHYEFHSTLTLDEYTGVMENTDWVLQAKVWGHEDGLAEKMELLEFHVN